MGHDGIVKITTVPMPANAQHVLLFDSTRRLIQPGTSAASAHAPGTFRSHWTGRRWDIMVNPTTDNVTVILELMIDPTGTTSSAFATDTTADSAGSITVTAGTPRLISWLPRTNDYRCRILAGATAPSALAASAFGVMDRSPGV